MSQTKQKNHWVRLGDSFININAITKVSITKTGYVKYIAIHLGSNLLESVSETFYHKWVEENNLDLPRFDNEQKV